MKEADFNIVDERHMNKLTYICDNKRHLICIPYSIENLHRMAKELNINRYWFHKNHYDIPKRRIKEIQDKCYITSPRGIVNYINSYYKAIDNQEK